MNSGLKELIYQLQGELNLIRTDLVLITHDIEQIRKQLDRIEMNIITQQPQESIGIAPNTPPPTFRPPEHL